MRVINRRSFQVLTRCFFCAMLAFPSNEVFPMLLISDDGEVLKISSSKLYTAKPRGHDNFAAMIYGANAEKMPMNLVHLVSDATFLLKHLHKHNKPDEQLLAVAKRLQKFRECFSQPDSRNP